MFLRHDYETIRVGDIIDAARVSRATFYTHFASKDAVLRELMAAVWNRARKRYQDFARLSDWSEASIRGWRERTFNDWKEHSGITLFVTGTLLSDLTTPQIAGREARYVAALMGSREKWRHFAMDEAERRAYMLIFLTERCLTEWASDRWCENRDGLLDTMVDAWRSILLPRQITPAS